MTHLTLRIGERFVNLGLPLRRLHLLMAYEARGLVIDVAQQTFALGGVRLMTSPAQALRDGRVCNGPLVLVRKVGVAFGAEIRPVALQDELLREPMALVTRFAVFVRNRLMYDGFFEVLL